MKLFSRRKVVYTILIIWLFIIVIYNILSFRKNNVEPLVSKDKLKQKCRNARDGVSGCRYCCQGTQSCVDVCMSNSRFY
jgi:hypothetical protein